jgi:ribosomal protein S18 acetylase RimI-like enzyme
MTTGDFAIAGPQLGQATHCEPILRALPDWFGIEQAIQHFVAEIDHLPTWLAYHADAVVGFLSLKVHNLFAAEVYLIAVRAETHRMGIGKTLMVQAEGFLRQQGVEYLQVKTLGPSHPDPGYAKTRAFYLALGFRPLEELTELWSPQNPCLILVKRL